MLDPWCRGCKARIEWHPHVDGRQVAIDPEPVADGPLAFGAGMKLGPAAATSRRRYRYHITGCPNPEKARVKAPDREQGCFRCGAMEHWAADCPEAN